MEEIARIFLKLDLEDLLIMYLAVLIAGLIGMLVAYEIDYVDDRHSKSKNNEKERNTLQDKDNDKN